MKSLTPAALVAVFMLGFFLGVITQYSWETPFKALCKEIIGEVMSAPRDLPPLRKQQSAPMQL